MSNDNRCVVCGRIIPEGRQICPLCEAGGDDKMKQLTICKEAAIVNVFKRNPSYYPYCPWCGQKLKE